MKERNSTFLDQLAGVTGHRYVYWVTLSMTQQPTFENRDINDKKNRILPKIAAAT